MTLAGCKLQPDAAPEPPSPDVTPLQSSLSLAGIRSAESPRIASGGCTAVADDYVDDPASGWKAAALIADLVLANGLAISAAVVAAKERQ